MTASFGGSSRSTVLALVWFSTLGTSLCAKTIHLPVQISQPSQFEQHVRAWDRSICFLERHESRHCQASVILSVFSARNGVFMPASGRQEQCLLFAEIAR